MSLVITQPNADTVVELDMEKHYALFHIAWEYSEQKIILEVKGAVSYTSYEDLIKKTYPRDEGMRIISVTQL